MTTVTIHLQGPTVAAWLAEHAPPGTTPPAPCIESDRGDSYVGQHAHATFRIRGGEHAERPAPEPRPDGRRLVSAVELTRWAIAEIPHQIPDGLTLLEGDDSLHIAVDHHHLSRGDL